MSESGGAASRRVRSPNPTGGAKIDSDVQVGADEGRKEESTAGPREGKVGVLVLNRTDQTQPKVPESSSDCSGRLFGFRV